MLKMLSCRLLWRRRTVMAQPPSAKPLNPNAPVIGLPACATSHRNSSLSQSSCPWCATVATRGPSHQLVKIWKDCCMGAAAMVGVVPRLSCIVRPHPAPSVAARMSYDRQQKRPHTSSLHSGDDELWPDSASAEPAPVDLDDKRPASSHNKSMPDCWVWGPGMGLQVFEHRQERNAALDH